MHTASDDDDLWPGRPGGSEAHPPHRFRRPFLTPEVKLKDGDEIPGTVEIPWFWSGGTPETNLWLVQNHLDSIARGAQVKPAELDRLHRREEELRAEVAERARRGDPDRERWEHEQAIRNNHDAVYTWALLNRRHIPITTPGDPKWEHYIADHVAVHGVPPKGAEPGELRPGEVPVDDAVAQPALF